MKYNGFGRSGLVMSRMNFGVVNFGKYDFFGFKSKVEEKPAKRIVDKTG